MVLAKKFIWPLLLVLALQGGGALAEQAQRPVLTEELSLPIPEGDEGIEEFLFERLFDVAAFPQTQFEPRLGASISIEADRVTVKLGTGRTWSDGRALTAGDVEASVLMDLVQGEALVKYLVGIDTPDERTVVFHFQSCGDILAALTVDRLIDLRQEDLAPWREAIWALLSQRKKSEFAACFELDDAYYARLEALSQQIESSLPAPHQRPASSAYCLEAEEEARYLLKRNAHYYNRDQVYFERLALDKPDHGGQVEAALSGGYDLETLPMKLEQLDKLKEAHPDLKTLWSCAAEQPVLFLNAHKYPTNILAVRQALASGVDREALLLTMNPGAKGGDPYCTGFPASWISQITDEAYLSELTLWQYDLIACEELLYNEGWKKDESGRYLDAQGAQVRLSLGVHEAASAEMRACARSIVASLDEAGISVDVIPYSGDAQAQDLNMTLGSLSSQRSRGMLGVYQQLARRGLLRTSERALLNRLVSTSDAGEVPELFGQLMSKLNRQVHLIPVADVYLPLHLHDGRLSGYPLDPQDFSRQYVGLKLVAHLVATGQLYRTE